jgi:hypothetical protein
VLLTTGKALLLRFLLDVWILLGFHQDMWRILLGFHQDMWRILLGFYLD